MVSDSWRRHTTTSTRCPSRVTEPTSVWRAVRVIDHLPMLYDSFDEEGVFQAVGDAGDRSASVTNEERFSGAHSVQVPPGASWQLKFPRPIAIRERPQWGEYRYLTFAVRRRAAGRFSIEFNTQQERELPVRYDGGRGPPSLGEAKRVFQDQLPDQWVEFPRDLYADFGPIEEGCDCFACRHFSRAYLRHLLNVNEILGLRMVSVHNSHMYLALMADIRAHIAAGRRTTGAQYLFRAANYYHVGERFLQPKTDGLAAYKRGVDCFRDAAQLIRRPKIEHVEIPYEGASLPAILIHAEAIPGRTGPAPAMVFFDGFDVTKEIQYFKGVPDLAARGIACLIVDGPGNGEAVRFRNRFNRSDCPG